MCDGFDGYYASLSSFYIEGHPDECDSVRGSPLTVTPLGRAKTVTVSGVSLYPLLLSIRWLLLRPKMCHYSYSVSL